MKAKDTLWLNNTITQNPNLVKRAWFLACFITFMFHCWIIPVILQPTEFNIKKYNDITNMRFHLRRVQKAIRT